MQKSSAAVPKVRGKRGGGKGREGLTWGFLAPHQQSYCRRVGLADDVISLLPPPLNSISRVSSSFHPLPRFISPPNLSSMLQSLCEGPHVHQYYIPPVGLPSDNPVPCPSLRAARPPLPHPHHSTLSRFLYVCQSPLSRVSPFIHCPSIPPVMNPFCCTATPSAVLQPLCPAQITATLFFAASFF